MPLYEITSDALERIPDTSFAGEGIRERQDLQRLLLGRIDVIDPELFVVAEEFGSWDESLRRIDILALDPAANLVVVELKRTRDGGHLELQALRYAAMVSTMTFEQVCHARQRFQDARNEESDAEAEILQFLGWDEPDEETFGNDVRIVLASEDFSKEVTSTVLWLNDRGLDIRCVRMAPYRLEKRLLVDVQQIIPLPEAEAYQIQVRNKSERKRRASGRNLSLSEIFAELERNRPPAEVQAAREIQAWIERNATLITTTDGFVAEITEGGVKHYPFKVSRRGDVRVWFQHLANRAPFRDEGLRVELLQRLNEIPGVEIGAERIGGKPRIELARLEEPDARRSFLATLDWIAGTIRSGAEGAAG